jgi:hypothetical protein
LPEFFTVNRGALGVGNPRNNPQFIEQSARFTFNPTPKTGKIIGLLLL